MTKIIGAIGWMINIWPNIGAVETSLRIIYWLPRILSIIAILVVTLFAFDVFDASGIITQTWDEFIIHLVPTYFLTVILVVSWKWEFTGGIIFLVVGLISSPYVFLGNHNANQSIAVSLLNILFVTFPFIIIGLLFLLSHYTQKKKKAINSLL